MASWVRDELDEFLWSVQRAILRALQAHRKVAVQACHGLGKSFLAARAGAGWIACHPPHEAQIVSTAPSGHQVSSILWKELQRAHTRGNLAGHITRGSVPEWVIDGEQVGFGRKPSDYVDLEKARSMFQGIHARYLLGLIDEGGGVPQWLFQAMETLITNEASRILCIGNPDDPTTYFAKICQPGSGWHVIQVSAYDTPNFTGEHVPEQLRESLVSRLWVEEREREWGVDSPLFISKVLGRFPEVADDVIISPKLVREAHERDRSGHAIADPGRYGMDVAEMGEDETAIYLARGGMIRLVEAWRKADVDVSRAKAQAILDGTKARRQMTIDKVGLGAGVWAPLRNGGYNVVGFVGGEKAYDADRFVNITAEAWWGFREQMEAGLIDLDPEDEVLAAQLQSRKWKKDSSQRRIRIETKDEMKKRGVKSPDRADAVVMANFRGSRGVEDASVVLRNGPGPANTIAGDLLTMRT